MEKTQRTRRVNALQHTPFGDRAAAVRRQDLWVLLAAAALFGLPSGVHGSAQPPAKQSRSSAAATSAGRRPSAVSAVDQTTQPGKQQPSKQGSAKQPPAKQQSHKQPPAGDQHPLEVPLQMALEAQAAFSEVHDYSATFVKRERIDGELTERHYLHMKCRQKPFSVYMRWIEPGNGREVLYVAGRHEGKLIAHETGLKDAIAGTLELEPTSERAMRHSRHAITEAGIGNLIAQMVSSFDRERRYAETEVKLFRNAKVEGRPCVCIQVLHPVPRREFEYHVSRLYIDDELKLPIRFEGYDWPARRGAQPELIEEYTYTKLRLNVGLSDLDFDVRNPQYSFYR
ncbi:MAG: DUF1571 domain-containing protein [Planctomycetes bacterium]|nr:DUF1571 domain-containing protein [Planctomycetota bacterium]